MFRRMMWVIGGLGVAGAALVVLLLLAHEDRDVDTAVIINAPPERVWRVLRAIDRYAEWNPLIRALKGDLRTGGRIEVTIEIPGASPSTFGAKVLEVTPNHEIRWESDLPVPRLFAGKYKLIMVPLDGGRTHLRHEQEFTGLLVGLFTADYMERTREGFELMNRMLKARVENGG